MIVALIQARMGSTRLPGKVLMPAAGKPLLAHLLERVQRAPSLQRVVVITSRQPQDDEIVDFCNGLRQEVLRGDETDVLDRYYQAACEIGASTVVRITADCPLIDPQIIEQAVQIFRANPQQFDLVTNRHPLTFPDGMDVDVMPLTALTVAWKNAKTKAQREHVIPYFWEASLRVRNFVDPENGFRRHRWTLDYAEDYELIRAIFAGLYPHQSDFGLSEILNFLSVRPELVELNTKYIPKT